MYTNKVNHNTQRLLEDQNNLQGPQSPHRKSRIESFDIEFPITSSTIRIHSLYTPATYLEKITSTLCFYSCLVTLTITIFLASFYFSSFQDNFTIITNTITDLQKDRFGLYPIQEMTLVNSSSKCPTGFEPLSLGQWPGTDPGCDCSTYVSYRTNFIGSRGSFSRGSTGSRGSVSSGSHSSGSSAGESHTTTTTGHTSSTSHAPIGYRSSKGFCDSGCTYISGENPRDLTYWDETLFCAKRLKIKSEYVREATCPSGFKQCAPKICVKESLECPITTIKLDSSNNPDSIGKLTASERYIIVERTIGEAPLIGLEISLNDIPCFGHNGIPSGSGDYPLLKKKPEGCSKYGKDDSFSFKIDNKTQKQVFTENHFPETVFKLPLYDAVLASTNELLIGKKEIELNNSELCQNIDTSKLSQTPTAAENFSQIIFHTILYGLLIHAFVFIVFLFVRAKISGLHVFPNFFSGFQTIEFGIFCLSCICITLLFSAMFVITAHHYSTVQQSRESLNNLIQNECLVGEPSRMLGGDIVGLLNADLPVLYWYLLVLLISCLASQIPVAILFICKKVREM